MATPTKPIKILMLHGFTQSGPLFRAKTRALEKNLQKAFPAGITLSYPTGPIHLQPADVKFEGAAKHETNGDEPLDAWGWWRRKGQGEPYTLEGMEMGFEKIAQVLREEGPFDGVIGFSQGGAAAGMVASLLEPGRIEAFEQAESSGGMRYPECFKEDTGFISEMIHPPMKFAVSYSGFGANTNPIYKAFYQPKIKTPMLHFLGSLDTVVEEKRSLRLVEACENSEGRVVYHPGGHFLPSSQRQYVGALIGFIKEVLGSDEKEKPEQKVEDMDVPF